MLPKNRVRSDLVRPSRPVLLFATTLFSMLGGVVDSALAEDVYKWQDRNRVTTYSQLPPAHGVRAQRLHTSSSTLSTSAGSAAAAPGTATVTPAKPGARATPAETPAQKALRAKLDAEANARMAQLATDRRAQCARARAQFDQLTQHGRMRVQETNGSLRVMPETERQKLINESKGRMVEFCAV